MQILVLHNNFPAQFKHLLPYLQSKGHDILFLSLESHGSKIKGVKHCVIKPKNINPPVSKKDNFFLLRKKLLVSELFQAAFARLVKSGYSPDLVIFHSGWGLGVHIRALFPTARLAAFAEWWFSWGGPLFDFEKDSPYNPPTSIRSRIAERYNNLTQASELAESDFIWSATHWQRKQFPPLLRNNMHVFHEGVDTNFFSPAISNKKSSLHITYTTRGLEPIRGFEHFMVIISQLMEKHTDLTLSIVGKDKPAYSPVPSQFDSLGTQAKNLFKSKNLDDRISWYDRMSYTDYRNLLRLSDIHFYFSRPFDASWSLLEAMSCGCCVVASDIEMVKEIGHDSLFYVNHLDHSRAVQQVSDLISQPSMRDDFSVRARLRALTFTHEESLRNLYPILTG